MYTYLFYGLFIAFVAAAPRDLERVVGGIPASIAQYPFMTVLLYGHDSSNYVHFCGGTIITTRSILTAAHCIEIDYIPRIRFRVGSRYAHSGGVVYGVETAINHPLHDNPYLDNDVSIVRATSPIAYSSVIQPAAIAGGNYVLPDNGVVWPVGWGRTAFQGSPSEELQHAQIWVINQELCAQRYAELNFGVTANMFCAGWIDMGGRGSCHGDSGGPVVHNGVVVGITAWGYQCAHGRYPDVNMRTSRYIAWIRSNAT